MRRLFANPHIRQPSREVLADPPQPSSSKKVSLIRFKASASCRLTYGIEACRRHGYLHGDVVITENGRVFTAIGIYDDMLWFHVEGSDGAGIWENQTLKNIGRTTVRPGPSKEAPTISSEWLKLDFLYTAGVTVSSAEIVPFDIRDEICMSVGGFKHGQVLEVPGIRKPVVTIGVRRNSLCVALWFHVKGSPGAGIFEERVLDRARVTGSQVVREHAMPLNSEPNSKTREGEGQGRVGGEPESVGAAPSRAQGSKGGGGRGQELEQEAREAACFKRQPYQVHEQQRKTGRAQGSIETRRHCKRGRG